MDFSTPSPIDSLGRGTLSRYRRRVQLGGALFFGVLLPYALRIALDPALLDADQVLISALGNLLCVIVGFWALREIAAYPGYRSGLQIIPILTVPYALIFLGFIALRMDYSRTVLLGGMLLSAIWYFWIFSRTSRQRLTRVGIVPGGHVDMLDDIAGVQWVRYESPPQVFLLDALVADFRADIPEMWERALADCALQGTPVYHVKDLIESMTGRVRIDHLSENNFGSLLPFRAYLKSKAAIDWVAALVVGAALLPILVLVGLAIRLDSRGPALFRQVRTGYRGEPFVVYKFRTMFERRDPAADDVLRASITTDADVRITRLGRFLRRSRIDELPQLLNILLGEMSWIGPRPEAEALSQWYERELPFYRYRHIVRPGITGWAQVNQGHVAEIDEVFAKLQYDFYYIKNFSPWLDILVVLRTARTMLTGFGAR